jgi:hypothetical protein
MSEIAQRTQPGPSFGSRDAAAFETWLIERKMSWREYQRKPPRLRQLLINEFYGPVSSLDLADAILRDRPGKAVVQAVSTEPVPASAPEMAVADDASEPSPRPGLPYGIQGDDTADDRGLASGWWIPWGILIVGFGLGAILRRLGVA